MPIDLSAPNSIIAAFARGREEALQRQQRLDQLAKQQKDEEFRKQQADEAKRQYDETFKAAQEELGVQHAYQQAQLKQHRSEFLTQALPGLQEQAEKYGNVAGWQKLAPVQGLNIPETTNTFIGDPNLGLGDLSFPARTPEEKNRQDIALATAQRAPIRQEAIDDYTKKSLIDQGREEALIALKDTNLTEHDKEMMSLDAGYKKAQSEIDYRHNLGLIDARGQWELATTGATSFEPWTALNIDDSTRKKYNLPEGSTWGHLGVNTMDATGKKKFEAYGGMESEIIKVNDVFQALANAKVSKGLFPNTPAGKDRALKSAYGDYFSGAWGNIQDLFPNLTQTELTNLVKPALGRVFLLAKEISNLGAALTENEKNLQKLFILTGDRNVTADAAMKIISNALPMIRQSRYETVQSYGVGKKGNSGIERVKIQGLPLGLTIPELAPK